MNDFFGIAIRYLRYNEKLFFRSSQLPLFGKFLIECIGLERQRAAKSHAEVFTELLYSFKDWEQDANRMDLGNDAIENKKAMQAFLA